MPRILVTGSRNWADGRVVRRILADTLAELLGTNAWRTRTGEVTVVHGAARGADRMAGDVAADLGCHVERHLADWDQHGNAAGHRRNAHMVALGADVVLAFPLGPSPGARGCIEMAQRAGLDVRVFDGTHLDPATDDQGDT